MKKLLLAAALVAASFGAWADVADKSDLFQRISNSIRLEQNGPIVCDTCGPSVSVTVIFKVAPNGTINAYVEKTTGEKYADAQLEKMVYRGVSALANEIIVAYPNGFAAAIPITFRRSLSMVACTVRMRDGSVLELCDN